MWGCSGKSRMNEWMNEWVNELTNGTSLVVQWWRLHAPNVGGLGSMLGYWPTSLLMSCSGLLIRQTQSRAYGKQGSESTQLRFTGQGAESRGAKSYFPTQQSLHPPEKGGQSPISQLSFLPTPCSHLERKVSWVAQETPLWPRGPSAGPPPLTPELRPRKLRRLAAANHSCPCSDPCWASQGANICLSPGGTVLVCLHPHARLLCKPRPRSRPR